MDIHDGHLFRENRLCSQHTLVQDFLVWEIHAGGLVRHFERDKTIKKWNGNFIGLV